MNLMHYLSKMRGSAAGSPPRVNTYEVLWSWIGGFAGIATVAWVHRYFFAGIDVTLLFGPLGASAVLAYGAIRSPLAQPRNLVGGHIVSAIAGVACYKLFHTIPGLAEASAVATAIAAMHLTRTLHPPGGATALIAVVGSNDIHQSGWLYVLIPGTLGPLILLTVALLVNNIPATRRYPETWL
jgi:CBS-domain-containing membrane protein